MKFQQLTAFEKHLEKATPDHLSRVYLVATPCAFERRKICETISSAIEKKEKRIAILRFDGASQSVFEELAMIGSFGAHRVVVLDEADKLKKNGIEALSAYVVKPSPHLYLIVSAATFKPFAELYEQGKKELVVCDLSAEKPWERSARLKAHLVKMAAKEKKTLSREAADLLLDKVGNEWALLEQEMNKLLCYCAAKPEIGASDVQALCHTQRHASVWNLAETIVWHEKAPAIDPSFELSSFLPLLGQVRAHLQQGMLLALRSAHTLPFFKPQLLEKIAPIARERGAVFFKEALQCIFDMEMLAKQSALAPSLLADLLIAKMDRLKKEYAVPVA
jgi:DNA polymerase III subunit delta